MESPNKAIVYEDFLRAMFGVGVGIGVGVGVETTIMRFTNSLFIFC